MVLLLAVKGTGPSSQPRNLDTAGLLPQTLTPAYWFLTPCGDRDLALGAWSTYLCNGPYVESVGALPEFPSAALGDHPQEFIISR